MIFSCWKCGKTIEYPSGNPVGKRDTCTKCDADLHVCRNCQYYHPEKHNQCSEPQAEWVRDKEAANYCDYFHPNLILMARGEPSSPADSATKKFHSLFKV